MLHHLRRDCAALYDCAFLRDIAPEDLDAAGLTVRIVDRADRIGLDIFSFDILPDGLSVRGNQRSIDQSFLVQLCDDSLHTACAVQVVHVRTACRCQVAQVRGLAAELVEDLHVQLDTGLVRDREQVQYGVGGAAQRHVACQRVTDGLLVDDLTGSDVLLNQIHDCHAGVLRQHDAVAVDSRDCAVTGQSDSKRLAEAVHAVRGVHAAAGSAARAYVLLELQQAFIVDDAGLPRAYRLEHLGKRSLLPANKTAHHRSTGADDCRNVQTQRAHEHSRYDLIAVRYQYESVELVRLRHGFHTVRDQFAAGERILHPDMTHRDAVTDTDRRNHDRGSTGHSDAGLDCLGDLIQMHMAWYDLTVRGNHADERLSQFFLGISHRVEQAPHRCAFYSLGYIVTSLRHIRSFLRETPPFRPAGFSFRLLTAASSSCCAVLFRLRLPDAPPVLFSLPGSSPFRRR